MKTRISSLTITILSVALILHFSDQMMRHAQEASVTQWGCPANGQTNPTAERSAYNPVNLHAQGGLGALIESEPRGVRLVSLIPGHAAEVAGLKTGDRIVRIDGNSAANRSERWAIAHLRGKIGTSVGLEVQRGEGLWQRTFRVELKRQHIESRYSVYSRLKNGELTIKLLWVDSSTPEQLARHLAQVSKGDVTEVVLDLQNLSYGSVHDAARCAALFLPESEIVGYLSASDDQRLELLADSPAVTDRLVAVEVGPYTARAGELLARALVNHLGVTVRGSETAGLGTLDRRSIRSRNKASSDTGFQLYDSQGKAIDGRPLKPSFWSWSNLLSPIPVGF